MNIPEVALMARKLHGWYMEAVKDLEGRDV